MRAQQKAEEQRALCWKSSRAGAALRATGRALWEAGRSTHITQDIVKAFSLLIHEGFVSPMGYMDMEGFLKSH